VASQVRLRKKHRPSCRIILPLVFCITTFISAPAFTQTFTPTGDLTTRRNGHRAISLNDGTILIVGGYDVNQNSLAASELYSPSTETFAATGSLNVARRNFGITLLDNGTVLITGGYDNSFNAVNSAEIYNPATAAFTLIGSMITARGDHTATRLGDGTVLIAGGFESSGNALSSAELYLPATGTFVPAGLLNNARGFATATALMDGRVLIEGGWAAGGALSTAELYDPLLGIFLPTDDLNVGRVRNTATLLNGGNVLIAGGKDSGGNILASGEIYAPTTGTFGLTGPMNIARGEHAATLLTNGTVLLEGGFACQPSNCAATEVSVTSSAEIYDPSAATFTATGDLNIARQVHTASLLANGAVLVAAGWTPGLSGITSAELYIPSTLAPTNLASIALTPASPTLLLGTSLNLVSIGIFSDSSTQTLASAIWSSSDNTVATVTSNAGGNSGVLNDSANYGTVLGVGAGTSTVSACTGSICGSTVVTVISPGSAQSFSLSAYPTSASVSAGGTATFQLTIAPQAGFNQNVSLSCAGIPANARCTISPATMSVDGTASSATVTVTTTSTSSSVFPRGNGFAGFGASVVATQSARAPWAFAIFPFGLALCLIAASRARRTTAAFICAVLLQLTACGGGVQPQLGTPSGNYVVVVTGTASSVTHSTSFLC
jgi:hypothetical protein